MMPHVQNTVYDINQTLLTVCQGIIFSSRWDGPVWKCLKLYKTLLHPGQTAMDSWAGRMQWFELGISCIGDGNVKVSLSLKSHWVNWRTQRLVSKGHISLIYFRSLILQKINWVINGRPLISHVNKSCPVSNWVKSSPELMMFPEGKNTFISMAFPWMFYSFSGLTILDSEAW